MGRGSTPACSSKQTGPAAKGAVKSGKLGFEPRPKPGFEDQHAGTKLRVSCGLARKAALEQATSVKRDHLLGKPVVMNGEEYKTVEHAFRALKAEQSLQKKRKIDTAATTDTATPPPQTPLTQKQRNSSRQWKTKWAYKREGTDRWAPRPEVSANCRAWYRVGNGKTETADAAFCDTCIKHGKENSFTAISGNVRSHTEQSIVWMIARCPQAIQTLFERKPCSMLE